MDNPPGPPNGSRSVKELREIKRQEYRKNQANQVPATSGEVLESLFNLDDSINSTLSGDLEPSRKKGPGVSLQTTPTVQPWVHTCLPTADSSVSEDGLDPTGPTLMCQFGRGGHHRVGRLLCKTFKHVDSSNLMQTKAAVKQYYLQMATECRLPEHHGPFIQRHLLFSLFKRGNRMYNLEEICYDVTFPDPEQADENRLSLEGICDVNGRSVGQTRFGSYFLSIIEGL